MYLTYHLKSLKFNEIIPINYSLYFNNITSYKSTAKPV